jgi:hypothetical protein
MICTGLDMRIVNPETGELLRELTIDPERDYQPTGKPRGRPRRTPIRNEGPPVRNVLKHDMTLCGRRYTQ